MLFATTWVDPEIVILSEVSQTEKEKYGMTSLRQWNLKRNYTHEFPYRTETHRLRKWTYGCRGEGVVREFGKVMYTLLYSKWITN